MNSSIIWQLLLLLTTSITFTLGCPKHCECNHGGTIVNCAKKSLMVIPPNMPRSTRMLNISGNFLGPIIHGSWAYMGNTTDIDLSQNGIVRIVGCSFKGLFRLKRLNLKGNLLRNLQEDLFSDNTNLEVLNLSNNKLETLQEPAFKYLRHLKELYLSDNYFTELRFGVRLQVLTNVEIFDLSYNNFGEISNNAFEMIQPWSTSVKRTLNLANCQITSIANETLSQYNGLYELILSGNKDISMENLRNVLKDLERKNLKKLDLSYMDLTKIDTLFVDTQYLSLISLNVSHNMIAAVDNGSFDSIRNLNTVDLSFNNLQTFSSEFAVLGNIKEFDISHNNISSIDRSVMEYLSPLAMFRASHNNLGHRSDVQLSYLQHITHLDLSFNHLDGMVLPGGTSQIEELNLAGNQISVLELLPLATKLTKFDISDNNISFIGPFVFTSTKSIKEANFHGNVINEIDDRAFLPNTPEVIDLSGNHLTTIHYCSWSDVRLLNLSNNWLSSVDYQTFYSMNKLNSLDLSNNRIETFHHETFKYLRNLTHLDLSRNKMKKQSEDENFAKLFNNLYSLIVLDMSFNDITFINSTALMVSENTEIISLANNKFQYISPELFSDLKNLKQIDLSNNPFDCGCELIPLVDWMKKNEKLLIKKTSNSSYVCNFPLERAGREITDYSVGVFECNIQLLHLSIFGSISVLLLLVGIAGGLVFHYYIKWRREVLPQLKKMASSETEVKIDRVRITDKTDIEVYPSDLMDDLDKHVKLKLKPLQNGNVQTFTPDQSSGYEETTKKISYSQNNLENGYGPQMYSPYSQYPRSRMPTHESYPYSLTLANSSYPYNYGLSNGYFIYDKESNKIKTDNENRKKKAQKEKEQREKERKKKEKKEKEKRDKEKKEKDKKEKERRERKREEYETWLKKHKKSDEKDKSHRHHHKSNPWKYNTVDRYQPSTRWDAMGRDRWQMLQWNALNKRYNDGRSSDRFMTLPPQSKMPYNGYPVYPPGAMRDRAHSLRPQMLSNRSQSNWDLPNGRFTRRATLPDPRFENELQNVLRRQREENERRKRKLSQEYRHWKRFGDDWSAEPIERQRLYESMQFEKRSGTLPARSGSAEVTFDPMVWIRRDGDLREKVRFEPYNDRAEQMRSPQPNFIPRSRSEIVYSGPSRVVAEDNFPHVGNPELSKSISVSEYGISRIPLKEPSSPADAGHRYRWENDRQMVQSATTTERVVSPSTMTVERMVPSSAITVERMASPSVITVKRMNSPSASTVEHKHESDRNVAHKAPSPITQHTAEIHMDEEVVRKTPDPDYPREGAISGWV